jgi:hypothetical protein
MGSITATMLQFSNVKSNNSCNKNQFIKYIIHTSSTHICGIDSSCCDFGPYIAIWHNTCGYIGARHKKSCNQVQLLQICFATG